MTSHHKKQDVEKSSSQQGIEAIYPVCRVLLGPKAWDRLVSACTPDQGPEQIPDLLELHAGETSTSAFLPSLARLERALHQVMLEGDRVPADVDQLMLNPTIHVLQLPWKEIPALVHTQGDIAVVKLELGEEVVLVWMDPKSRSVQFRPASDEDLLVLKMVAEGISTHTVAAMGTVLPAAVGNSVRRAVGDGLLLAPPSRIRRDPASFAIGEDTDDRLLSSPTFILQWHITQAYDLHCKHCYDRSDRSPLQLDQAFRILDELQ